MVDAGPDVVDAAPDVVDATPDVVDAAPDVKHVSCEEAGITYIYLISSENELLRFYPPSLKFSKIGTIGCPTVPGDTPFSMAVDREGIAYVLFQSGGLFRVSTLTASCQTTSFVPDPSFSTTFGMGFSANQADQGETLYVAANQSNATTPSRLGSIDVTNFTLQPIAMLSLSLGNPELTGTGDGRLYGFGPNPAGSHIAEIDKTTGAVKSDVTVDLQESQFTAWAFAFWGGDFYTFTSPQTGSTIVHRYTPGGSTTPPVVAKTSYTIVGAGVSTCAPSK